MGKCANNCNANCCLFWVTLGGLQKRDFPAGGGKKSSDTQCYHEHLLQVNQNFTFPYYPHLTVIIWDHMATATLWRTRDVGDFSVLPVRQTNPQARANYYGCLGIVPSGDTADTVVFHAPTGISMFAFGYVGDAKLFCEGAERLVSGSQLPPPYVGELGQQLTGLYLRCRGAGGGLMTARVADAYFATTVPAIAKKIEGDLLSMYDKFAKDDGGNRVP